MTLPYLVFARPTSNYNSGEQIVAVMLPAQGGQFDVSLSPQPVGWCTQNLFVEENRLTIKPPLPPGEYALKARWQSDGAGAWSAWSAPLPLTIHPADRDLQSLWENDHRLALMLEKCTTNALTLVDPEAEPPGLEGLSAPKWFRTPVYEGATPLVNEDPAYYQDPCAYYFDCIDRLVASGARFVTWHDLLAGDFHGAPLEILLQFDVDGGPRSMRRLYGGLVSRGIRGTIMIHRRGHFWYSFELGSGEVEWLQDAESRGWAIGYHNNALSQLIGDDVQEAGRETLQKAAAIFRDDVFALRRHFNIRTFTHHGGNVYNLRVVPPGDLEIIGVDRGVSPDLWKSIRTMFSDGGFVSRPCTLRRKAETLPPGLHFFRNHPFKYGNYSAPVDVLPRFEEDFGKAALEPDRETLLLQERELQKEARWLRQRQSTRSCLRLAHLRLDKPISSRFGPYRDIETKVVALRARRRENFLRLYPWAQGDPRVFWWRMLEAWAPNTGRLLNVGALPCGQKDEHAAFLHPNISLEDMDVDPNRKPDHLLDICEASTTMDNSFAGVLLFGLPYFAAPKAAVAACARLTRDGGVGLFGFVADTHPARGSIFHPGKRHAWSSDREPLGNIGLKGNLWAFEAESLPELFQSWDDVKIEGMGHYWFVVAQKSRSA